MHYYQGELFTNIMAAMRLIGSLYIYSEAGGAAAPGRGQKPIRGRLAPPGKAAGGNWREPWRRRREPARGC